MSENKKKSTDLNILKENSESLINDAVKRHIEETENHDPRYVNGNIVLIPISHYENIKKAIDTIRIETDSINSRFSNDIRQEVKVSLNMLNLVADYIKKISESKEE